MFYFISSSHSLSWHSYKQSVAMSHVADPVDRIKDSKKIEDGLVAGGIEAIEAYELQCQERKNNARGLAKHDGVTRALAIAEQAEKRLLSEI